MSNSDGGISGDTRRVVQHPIVNAICCKCGHTAIHPHTLTPALTPVPSPYRNPSATTMSITLITAMRMSIAEISVLLRLGKIRALVNVLIDLVKT